MPDNKKYWITQLLIWTAYGLLNALYVALAASLTASAVVFCVLFSAVLLLASHSLRALLRRRKWLEKPLPSLSWRVALTTVGLALLSQLAIFVVMGGLGAAGLLELGAPQPARALLVYWINTSIILMLWSFAYVAYKWFERWRTGQIDYWRTQTALREAELAYLRAQLDPHFLFNALNNIRAVIAEDAGRGREMITHLSQTLRHVMQHARHDSVLLHEELEAVRDYLALMRLHYEDRLAVTEEIDPQTLQARVPPLVLQLLVENAIKHGISRLGSDQVHIRASMQDRSLHLEVVNGGALDRDTGGVGLENLRRRLSQAFGTEARVALEQAGGRVHALVTVPQ